MANKPFNILVSEEGNDGKIYYHKIGVAFPAKSGEGFDCKLNSLPINNGFIIRPPFEDEDNKAEEQADTKL